MDHVGSAVEPMRSESITSLAALSAVLGRHAWSTGRGRNGSGGRLAARMTTRGSYGVEKLEAVTD
jgi:hypothetical protein